jgi:hypothetical protein
MVFTIIVEIWLYKLVKSRRLKGEGIMLQIDEKNLKDLESRTGRTLVGELLHQIEVVEAQQLTKEATLSLLKPLIKNKIYESLRQHTGLITQFSNGVSFSIDFLKFPQA